jgi:hypothetical protein
LSGKCYFTEDLQKTIVMACFRPVCTFSALSVFLFIFAPLGADADIRVWTDKEEVIL